MVKIAPYFPHKILGLNKLLLENDDDYIFFEGATCDFLYPNLKNSLIEEIKKFTPSSEKYLSLKLIDVNEAEKNLRAEQLEKLKLESIKEIESGIEKYAILSYVWGKNETNTSISNKILNNSGRKALTKAINACKCLGINYLWMDQLCVDQKDDEAISYQISKLGQYYSNAAITLVAIQTKVFNEHKKKEKKMNEEEINLLDALETIVVSKWFSRPWTYQEGWLSKRSVFMFDDCLVNGQTLAQIWVLHQPSHAKVKFNSYEESIEGSEKIATPLGWVYCKDGYLAEDKVFINLREALKEVKKRGKNEFIEGIYSILGLLPYGEKVRVRWRKVGYEYPEEEFQEILLDIVKVAVEEGYGEDFQNLDFIDISETIREKIKELCRLKDERASHSNTENYKNLESKMEKLEKEANEINSTLLHIVVANNEKNLAIKLLESGNWSANAKDGEDNTIIHTAAGVNSLDLLKLLVRYGANINYVNDDGWTVLHSAAWGIINSEKKANWEVIRWLLKQKGLESDAKTKKEITARDIFLQKDQTYAEIYDKLLEDEIEVVNYLQEQIESVDNYDYSSIKTERGKNEKLLDTLARLITGNETCVAVCYYQEKLFIASNREKVEYAKEYLGKLRKFISDNSSENYKKLVETAIEQTYFECLKNSNSWWIWPEGKKKNLKEFRRAIMEYKRNMSLELEELQEIAKELHKEVIGLKQGNKSSEANKKWDYLIHWHDVGEITNMVMKGELEETIIDAIRNDSTKYIEVKDKQKSKLHAEMKIVEEICKIKEKTEAYIGVTKSSCVDCYSVIGLLNNDGYRLSLCGTHCQSYKWWTIPEVIESRKEEFKKKRNENKLKFKLTKKKTSSKIPRELNNIVQLLKDLQSQEQLQSQIHISPKSNN